VRAVTDVTALEVTADRFRQLAMARPTLVEHVASAVETRRRGLEQARAEDAAASTAARQRSLFDRIQRFLRLP
jgi:CRP-like cAMP-binding protein